MNLNSYTLHNVVAVKSSKKCFWNQVELRFTEFDELIFSIKFRLGSVLYFNILLHVFSSHAKSLWTWEPVFYPSLFMQAWIQKFDKILTFIRNFPEIFSCLRKLVIVNFFVFLVFSNVYIFFKYPTVNIFIYGVWINKTGRCYILSRLRSLMKCS